MNSQHIHQQALALGWMRLIVFLFIISHLSFSASAQAQLEYWFDQDPGLGRATVAQGAVADAEGNVTFEAPTAGLAVGSHLMGVRSINTNDKGTYYGPTLLHTVLVPHEQSEASVSCIEYYWDNDPGRGKACIVNVSPGDEVNLDDLKIPTDGLAPGIHLLGLRAFGNCGWGPTMLQEVRIPVNKAGVNITLLEYFWGDDPGYGLGIPIAFTPDKEVNLTDLEISSDGLNGGIYQLGLRVFGNDGWGPTLIQEVQVPTDKANILVKLVEYFWDNDPGYSKGIPIAFAANREVSIENLELPTDGLDAGTHVLGIRAYGNVGWTPTVSSEIYIAPDPAKLIVSQAEYFWDNDPGYGQGTPISITEGQSISVESLGIPTDNLTPGDHQLFVRYRGPQGWSPTLCSDVRVLGETPTISAAEYFWNDDPGYGQGIPLNIEPGQMVTINDVGIPSFDVHGDATLFIRYRGTTGWSPTVAYVIMVDAEGHYTLNAAAETSMENRNYQSFTDALDDFADRGVGNDITLELTTTNNDYALDATTDERIAQLTTITAQIKKDNTTRHQKAIGFTANEGSGNTVTVTTTAEGLPAVVAFFAQTSWQNVSLTINGTVYDFTPASQRMDETCSDNETAPVALSAISSAVRTTWTAQPHEGTMLSGFVAEGTGDLTAMTIVNSGTKTDSLAYQVTLADTEGNELCTYLYYIYVHPRVGNQTFSSLLPKDDSSLDPGEVTLRWNAIGGVEGGYRVDITETDNAEEPSASNNSYTTTETSLKLTVKSGYTYIWTVTAMGSCDELTSTPQTYKGRLLPDFVVEDITLSEGAEAGNTITIKAIVKNQGEGDAIEGSWIDRLYYIIDSEDFAKAVQAAEATHDGNLAVGDSYEVIFTMKVPYLESGNLRVFVETDVTSAVMETNDNNNRTLSTASATLQPFYMNAADLAVLRQLYSDFDGSNWNGTRWNTASELITENNWSGVTFNTEGRVTAINLKGRGLKGTLSAATTLYLPALTSLNLSHNALTGDVTPFVTTEGLTSLDVSYNQISDVSAPLPSTISSLNISNQVLTDVTDFDLATMIDDTFLDQLPTIVRYDHKSQNYMTDVKLRCVTANGNFVLNRSNGETTVSPVSSSLVYKGMTGDMLSVSSESGLASGTTFRMTFTFPQGDATFNGVTDILDLQATINYMFFKWNGRLFNYAAVNLYPDESINIQDAIRLIDVLINEPWYDKPEIVLHAPLKSRQTKVPARLFVDGNLLKLSTTKPVAALDIVLSDCDVISDLSEITSAGLTYNTRQTETSHRLIAYSFNGGTLPVGETTLCRLEGDTPCILRAKLSDVDANEVIVDFSHSTTGVSDSSAPISFKLYSIAGILLKDGTTSDLRSTLNSLPIGTYILRLSYGNGKVTQSKIRIESR